MSDNEQTEGSPKPVRGIDNREWMVLAVLSTLTDEQLRVGVMGMAYYWKNRQETFTGTEAIDFIIQAALTEQYVERGQSVDDDLLYRFREQMDGLDLSDDDDDDDDYYDDYYDDYL